MPRAAAAIFSAGAGSAAASPPPGSSAGADTSAPFYRRPVTVLADLVDAPPPPEVLVDPGRHWLLVLSRRGLPPIAELARREVRVAGLRIDPRSDGRSRQRYFAGMKLVRIADGAERKLTGLPRAARLSGVSWSPDGSAIAFTHTRDDGIELWAADLTTGAARRLTEQRLNAVLSPAPQWLPDSRSLLCALVPAGRGPEPARELVPSGPVVQEASGQAEPARTFRDVLRTAADEGLFEHYAMAQLARMGLGGEVTAVGAPGLHRASPSPDGKYLLVETFHRPYSHLVTIDRFARHVQVWDARGALVREIADLPAQESVPIGFDNVSTGPRSIDWRDDAPATLAWAEALDGGDAGRAAKLRDRVVQLAAPFSGKASPLLSLSYRWTGVVWGSDRLALITERWWKTRRVRTWIVRPGNPQGAAEVLVDLSFEDRYADPGNPLTRINVYGRPVLRTAAGGSTLYFAGMGASPEGDRPFFDTLDLARPPPRRPVRLFRSQAPYYEMPVELVGVSDDDLLVRRESAAEPPNYFVRNLRTNRLRQVTFFPHPTPQLAGATKELIHYRRADGVPLTAILHLPAGYRPGQGPLPMLIWAYPEEFQSAAAAGQVGSSPYRFDLVTGASPVVWTARGYAVLERPTLPIVAPAGGEPNDTYVEQLVAGAAAAVDEVVRPGVARRDRIAIAGHSYGAAMAANLLAHSRLFAAGIALSGAYNRTLTPFGFQREERTLWAAPQVYFEVSPLVHADRIAAPLLLIHGEADENAGTDPLQSERFYGALKGLGGRARLVILPHEGHAYQARESVLHALWEIDRWLDIHLKR